MKPLNSENHHNGRNSVAKVIYIIHFGPIMTAQHKKRIFRLTLSALLSATILFGQVFVNYFHDRHDAHNALTEQSDAAALVEHGEHCKVCSLDMGLKVCLECEFVNDPVCTDSKNHSDSQPLPAMAILALSQGRAPPAYLA